MQSFQRTTDGPTQQEAENRDDVLELKSRVAHLEEKLREGNGVKPELLLEEHNLRLQLMREMHKATLSKIRLEAEFIPEKEELEIELLRVKIRRQKALLNKALL